MYKYCISKYFDAHKVFGFFDEFDIHVRLFETFNYDVTYKIIYSCHH